MAKAIEERSEEEVPSCLRTQMGLKKDTALAARPAGRPIEGEGGGVGKGRPQLRKAKSASKLLLSPLHQCSSCSALTQFSKFHFSFYYFEINKPLPFSFESCYSFISSKLFSLSTIGGSHG